MSKSIEWNCEEVMMAMLTPDARLAGIDFKHHEDVGAGALDVLVFKATPREQQSSGCKGVEVDVSITYASATATEETADKIAAAMLERSYEEHVDVDFSNLVDVAFVSVENGFTARRDDLKKSRKRVLRVPLIAKLL